MHNDHDLEHDDKFPHVLDIFTASFYDKYTPAQRFFWYFFDR